MRIGQSKDKQNTDEAEDSDGREFVPQLVVLCSNEVFYPNFGIIFFALPLSEVTTMHQYLAYKGPKK